METYAHRILALIFTCLICTPSTAEIFSSECGFTIELSPEMAIQRNEAVSAPLCSYISRSEEPTPFVNSITVLLWDKLDTLQVSGQPLRDIGFFRLSQGLSITHIGRPSYSDPRNLYVQTVVKKSYQKRELRDHSTQIAIHSELRVKWLKPIDAANQEEKTDMFTCVDAAVSNDSLVAIFNWCVPKTAPNVDQLIRVAKSLRLKKPVPEVEAPR